MKTNNKTGFFLLASLISVNSTFAQNNTQAITSASPTPFAKAAAYRTWSLGVNGGVLTPVVGIGGQNDFSNWKNNIGYGGYIKKQLGHHFGLQADFLKGRLEADNTKPFKSGIIPVSSVNSFQTEITWSATLSGVFNFGNFSILNRQSYITPYVTAGAGLMGYQPTIVTSSNQTIAVNNGEDIRELVIPISVGSKFMLSKGVNLDLGYKMNFVDSDNLDGYRSGTQSDKFSYGYVGLEFALGNATKPQLAFINPAAVLEKNYIAKYEELKAELEASKNQDELNAIKNQVNKLMTDADGDGVSDFYDKCPNTPAGTKVDGAGCTLPIVEIPKPVVTNTYIITEEDKKIVTEAIKNLEFDLSKSTIRATSFASLDRVAKLITSKNLSLKLAGHTDSQGSNAYNMKLSKDRAESVKAYLVSKGVNPSRIEATGYGESQPIDNNNTETGRQNNRRVEFTLYN